MSYKDTVIADYPITYLRSSNVTSTGIATYQDVLNNFNTYSQLISAGPEDYSNLVGSAIIDESPCANNAAYLGDIQTNLMPIIPGETYGMKVDVDSYIVLGITNDYQGTLVNGSAFGTAYNSDNDFTLSLWVRPKISSTGLIPLLADTVNNIGIYYQKGNIVFKLQNEVIEYTLPYLDRSFYIAGTYTGTSMNLYIDGDLKSYKSLNNFSFTNTSINLQSGPTSSNEYFLTNGIAVYRYALGGSDLQSHMSEAIGVPPIQVVAVENGRLFELQDTNTDATFNYSYPANKSWSFLVTDGLAHDTALNNLYMTKTDSAAAKTVEVFDYIMIPSTNNMDSSKIEWSGDNGVSIFASVDGTNYTQCINGGVIPGYSLSSFNATRNLYLKFVFTSTDASRYLPKLEYIIIKFYNNHTEYSTNSAEYFSTLEGIAGVSNYDATIGNSLFPALIRDGRNGVKTFSASGFLITPVSGVRALEFFYTPSTLTTGGLFSGPASYTWNGSGVLSSSGVSWIYVNGVDKTTATNVSQLFEAGETYHVVVGLSSTITNPIRFGYTTSGAVPSRYQNIALFESILPQSKAIEHYNLYIGNSTVVVNAASFSMTESSTEYYNIDWTVVENS